MQQAIGLGRPAQRPLKTLSAVSPAEARYFGGGGGGGIGGDGAVNEEEGGGGGAGGDTSFSYSSSSSSSSSANATTTTTTTTTTTSWSATTSSSTTMMPTATLPERKRKRPQRPEQQRKRRRLGDQGDHDRCKVTFALFQERFGVGSYERLDALVADMCPNPDGWSRGHGSLDDFFGSRTGKEPKFAGSDLSSFLLPSSERSIGGQAESLLAVKLDQQAALLESNRQGYLVTSNQHYASVSASKVADATYSLNLSALSQSAQGHLMNSSQSTRYPCLHSGANRLGPSLSVEFKVDGGIQKQKHQQALYRSWNVYRQLVTRTLTAGDETMQLQGLKHYCRGIFEDNLECWEYGLHSNPLGQSKSFRIRAQLLCKGSMHAQGWFRRVYCPWRFYLAKEAIFQQAVYVLPDIERYAALSGPRAFDHGAKIFIVPRDFIPGSGRMHGCSFGNQPTAAYQLLANAVDSWRLQNAYTISGKKRQSQSGESPRTPASVIQTDGSTGRKKPRRDDLVENDGLSGETEELETLVGNGSLVPGP
ncbi:MAG: hypothetical protein M1816_003158 [Peltula sp. TS41687]|nr:MAG: hypothetical protein M1816_003158 [Peltula sp. TS41687]